MISRLISIDVNPVNTKAPIKTKYNAQFTINDYAKSFISGMEKNQLNRFKKMLENNITSGMSVAENYGINYKDFIKEVKKELNIKEK